MLDALLVLTILVSFAGIGMDVSARVHKRKALAIATLSAPVHIEPGPDPASFLPDPDGFAVLHGWVVALTIIDDEPGLWLRFRPANPLARGVVANNAFVTFGDVRESADELGPYFEMRVTHGDGARN